jgi:small subunit ribosomal protein S10
MKSLNKNYKIRIRLKSFIKIDLVNNFLLLLRRLLMIYIKSNNLYLTQTIVLEKNLYKNTIIRSPHVNKQSQEQFEIRTYNCLITANIKFLSKKNLNNIMKLIELNIPFGFDVSINILENA